MNQTIDLQIVKLLLDIFSCKEAVNHRKGHLLKERSFKLLRFPVPQVGTHELHQVGDLHVLPEVNSEALGEVKDALDLPSELISLEDVLLVREGLQDVADHKGLKGYLSALEP